MELIFDVKKMTQAVVEMKYDVRKMPLGKLTHDQIKAGYESLKAIESLLKVGPFGRSSFLGRSIDLPTTPSLRPFPLSVSAVKGQQTAADGRQQRLLHTHPARLWHAAAACH